MKYLEMKKRAFMSIVNAVKGFVRTVSGIPPITLPDCVDNDSLISYSISGNSVQNGEPTPENPVEVESVGEKIKNLFDYTAFCNEYNAVNTNNSNYHAKLNDTFLEEECFSIPIWNYTDFKYLNNYLFKENTQYVLKCEMAMEYGNNASLTASSILIFYTDGTFTSIRTTLYNNQFVTATVVTDANKTVDYIRMNNVALNFRVYIKNIQLEEGEVATEYELFGKYKIPIKMRGKNLIKYPYPDTSKTLNGLTFTDNGDGTVTVNGTATANTNYNIRTTTKSVWEGVEPNETYTASLTLDGYYKGSISFIVNYYPEGSSSYTGWLTAGVGKPATKICPENIAGIRSYLYISSGTVVENLTIKPQLEKGETATEFEPYIEPIYTNIYLDEPLALGKVLEYPRDNIPKLPTIKGTTIYSIETAIQPSNMSATYYSTSKE